MNAINDLRHAEASLIESIDRATDAVNQIAFSNLQAALDRYRKAVEDATHRMREAASVVGNLATDAMFDAISQVTRVEEEFAAPKLKAEPKVETPAETTAPTLSEVENEDWDRAETMATAAYNLETAATESQAVPVNRIGKPKKRKSGKASSNGFHR
jgi:hypothetical protein